MKSNNLFIFAAIMLCSYLAACKKDTFITSTNALLYTSEDTLHFDTVFTEAGSITQSFKIFNANDQKLLVSTVELAGGTASVFKLNVDGQSGTTFNNIEIAPNDSIYVFVAVNINPGTYNQPFLLQDSVRINYNGKETFVQLDAYGQNARFLRNGTVTKDTTWTNDLPVVIIGTLTVNQGSTLTLNKGVRIYCHADGAIKVNGTLNALGDKGNDERIIFRGDRLDDYYKNLPGSWLGITFGPSSISNQLNYTGIFNAKNAVTADNQPPNNNPKLTMNQCIITNASGTGIFSVYSSINATNCLISNCANNIRLVAGGNYNFTHCTVVGYNTTFVFHESPVLIIGNTDDNNLQFPLTANFTNSIFYGDQGFVTDEIITQKTGSTLWNLNFENVIYRDTGTIDAVFTSSIQNTDPAFVNIDYTNNYFDFHLQPGSPAVNTGKITAVTKDLDGNLRDGNPDIGCYELQ